MMWSEYVLFGIAILTVVFAVYKRFSDPDNKAATDITMLNERVTVLRADIVRIDERVTIVRQEVSDIKTGLQRLITIIDERIPNRSK